MRNRIGLMVPVTLGACLWLGGNMMMPSAPARGQEVVDNPGCKSEQVEMAGHQECGNQVNGQCPGNWVDGYYTISECKGPELPPELVCQSGTADAFLEIDQGNCFPVQGGDPPVCMPGPITQRDYRFVKDQPSCKDVPSGVVTP